MRVNQAGAGTRSSAGGTWLILPYRGAAVGLLSPLVAAG